MAQSGYALDPGTQASTGPNVDPASTGAKNSAATQSSFDQNRQTIPGLGLGFFGRAQSSAPDLARTRAGNKAAPTNAKPAEDSQEEGEIAEDDFEDEFADLYETQEPAPAPAVQSDRPLEDIDASYVEMSDEERDRSGSYSPFLSAGEMEGLAPEPTQLSINDSDTVIVHDLGATQTPKDTLEATKLQAKEAILRLQAANIPFQNYINEGIDKTILDQLFNDLGLEKLPPPAALNKAASQKQTAPATIPTAPAKNGKSSTSAEVDKSEERKDRIARLLAAKGSKSTKSGTATVIGKVAKPPNVKANSEKSKLLQRKMEALLKAREEKQQELERQTAAAAATIELQMAATTTNNANENTVHPTPANDQATNTTASEAVASAPSTKLTASNSGSGSASEGPFQKPVGYTRPFLINVSDDEDDAEMEIESPELRTSSLHAPTSPSRRQTLVPSLLQSPASLATPPAGHRDLDNMNKEIQAMKRKIAEAEAKKRLKLSAPASPAASPRPKAYDIYEGKSSSPDISAAVAHSLGAGSSRLPKVAETRMASPGSPKINRSRAASERLPMLESRRKEQLLRLKALQSQVANIERELKEGFEEEQKLREDLDYISDDDVAMPSVPEPVAPRPMQTPQYNDGAAEKTRQNPSNPIDVLSSDHIATESSSVSSPEAVAEAAAGTLAEGEAVQAEEPLAAEPEDEDVAMEDANSSGEEADDDSDGYEPEEASPIVTGPSSPAVKQSQAEPDATDSDPAVAALNAELLSAGRQASAPAESDREVVPACHTGKWPSLTCVFQVQDVATEAEPAAAKSSFLPYDSPLRYFHSFRFHPDFNSVVAGGLRSATYSNKIDAKQPICPDELAGKTCPRGQNCHFQHFAEMSAPGTFSLQPSEADGRRRHAPPRAPVMQRTDKMSVIADDQILLQLGAYANCEESRKQEYISGLRELLTDYRNRKVKDFKTISQGILEYRAKFHGDDSKVLPLGTVSL